MIRWITEWELDRLDPGYDMFVMLACHLSYLVNGVML
jgi:hypothetical protein